MKKVLSVLALSLAMICALSSCKKSVSDLQYQQNIAQNGTYTATLIVNSEQKAAEITFSEGAVFNLFIINVGATEWGRGMWSVKEGCLEGTTSIVLGEALITKFISKLSDNGNKMADFTIDTATFKDIKKK